MLGAVMIDNLFYVSGLVGAVLTVNALRRPGPVRLPLRPIWLPGMVVSEMAPLLLMACGLTAAVFYGLGLAGSSLGRLSGGLLAFNLLGLTWLVRRTSAAVRSTGHKVPLTGWLWPRERRPDGVETLSEVPYAPGLTLDVYRRPGVSGAPTLVYLHAGSWMRGRPGRQARPMLYGLAARGWVVLDIRYPLSPEATFPDHLVGVKRAIAWARTAGPDILGVDPGRIAIAGASAGAHLAALAALTFGRPELQPGFEQADVRPDACLAFYGIYDLFVRNPTRRDWPFIPRLVMKADRMNSPELFRLGSPIDQVRADAPPFFVVHGDTDSVVRADEGAHLVEALTRSGAMATFVPVRGGQHGFDGIPSARSRAVGAMSIDWLEAVLAPSPGQLPKPGG